MNMLDKLVAHQLVTPPSIWGKLPGHADFVRSAMRHGESEGWRPWLANQGALAEPAARAGETAAALPTAFVLPPGTLKFARRRFVVGVIAPSHDRVGRHHPLLVYHLAHRRWIEHHFEAHAAQPREWLFWLARALVRHAAQTTDIHRLEHAVRVLWLLHAPQWRDLWSRPRDRDAWAEARCARSSALLDKLLGPASSDDPAARLFGVRYLPWCDWPHRLLHGRRGAFWRQDASGRFVDAASRLPRLWEDRP